MTDDGKAGGVVTRVLVRKNLIVRLAAPRFFRQGDETVLRVIAHNYLATAKDVTFALDVSGVDVLSGQTQKVTIPANAESYVDWRVKARVIGNAVLTAKALTNEESDALEMTLPILPYGVQQSAVGTGVVFSGAGQNQWTFSYPAASDPGSRVTYRYGHSVRRRNRLRCARLPHQLSMGLHRANHVELPARPDRGPGRRQAASQVAHRPQDAERHGQRRTGAALQLSARRWRLGMVAGRSQPRLHDRLRCERIGPGARRPATPSTTTVSTSARNWLQSTLAAHPDMIPDLRAYTVYALATTGGAPKDALDKTWDSRDKLSDEGLALTGLALDAAGDARAHQAAELLEKKAHATDVDAYWEGNYDGMMDFWDDTSPETTAFALKLLIRQDRSSGLMPKAARWLAEHRDGGFWYSTKQTSMVIQGLTDYLALSGELANTSDVEVLVNGTSVGKRHFGPDDAFAAPWQIKVPAAQATSGGQVTIRKSGNGITYWSAENSWYSADRKSFQQGQLALNITRDYYLLQKRQDKPTDPITYDLVPLKGPVHIGDIIAVKLALNGTNWKYLEAEDPIPAGTEFLSDTGLYTLNSKPDWWADFFTRKEFRDDRAAFFNTDFSTRTEYVYLLEVDNSGLFQISPAQAGPMYQTNVQTTTDPATLEVQP